MQLEKWLQLLKMRNWKVKQTLLILKTITNFQALLPRLVKIIKGHILTETEIYCTVFVNGQLRAFEYQVGQM